MTEYLDIFCFSKHGCNHATDHMACVLLPDQQLGVDDDDDVFNMWLWGLNVFCLLTAGV